MWICARLALVCLTLLHFDRCTSYSVGRRSATQSISSMITPTQMQPLHMKQSNFEEEEEKSLADIINSPGISIGAGVGGIFVLLANRLSFGDIISDVQSRADIISVIACSALLLNVLSEQDITARTRDAVPLVGYAMKTPQVQEAVVGESQSKRDALAWCVDTILKTTPATSVHVILDENFLVRGGVVGMGDDRASSEVKNVGQMAILQKTLRIGEEVYLPDLQILPGKVEFYYLPINCQSVLILPIPDGGAVIISTNQAKILKLKDLNRIRSTVSIFKNIYFQ